MYINALEQFLLLINTHLTDKISVFYTDIFAYFEYIITDVIYIKYTQDIIVKSDNPRVNTHRVIIDITKYNRIKIFNLTETYEYFIPDYLSLNFDNILSTTLIDIMEYDIYVERKYRKRHGYHLSKNVIIPIIFLDPKIFTLLLI